MAHSVASSFIIHAITLINSFNALFDLAHLTLGLLWLWLLLNSTGMLKNQMFTRSTSIPTYIIESGLGCHVLAWMELRCNDILLLYSYSCTMNAAEAMRP